MEKRCSKCREIKSLDQFPKNRSKCDGVGDKCKDCNNVYHREYHSRHRDKKAAYYQRTKLEQRSKRLTRYQQNQAFIKQQMKAYYAAHREEIRARQNAWRSGTRYQQIKYTTDPIFKVKTLLRNRLRSVLRRCLNGAESSISAVRHLGCSMPEFMEYIESRFLPGMAWDNSGNWHLDHIKPLASFDLLDRNQVLSAIHFTNLQPMWAEDNIRKGSKI